MVKKRSPEVKKGANKKESKSCDDKSGKRSPDTAENDTKEDSEDSGKRTPDTTNNDTEHVDGGGKPVKRTAENEETGSHGAGSKKKKKGIQGLNVSEASKKWGLTHRDHGKRKTIKHAKLDGFEQLKQDQPGITRQNTGTVIK
eukprot:UN27170